MGFFGGVSDLTMGGEGGILITVVIGKDFRGWLILGGQSNGKKGID
jgi:hypothetical protein